MLNNILRVKNNILLRLNSVNCHLTEKKINILLERKIILSILMFILSAISTSFVSNSFFISNTSALEYSNDTNLEFTFNPTLSLSLSGNLMIDNLIPGSSSDSNSINVNISTNNVTGYNLSATVGSSNNATTNLTNGSNSNYTFTSLTSDTTNLTDFNPNTWGYSYSVDNGTTWSNYSGLPIYTTTGTNLNTTSINSSDTINFKIGAKASNTQPLGEYTNTINFVVTTNPTPYTFDDAFTLNGKTKTTNGYYKMQDMTRNICETTDQDQIITLIDIRDNQIYMIGKAKDDNCWMLQNLKLGKTTTTLELDNITSNTDENGFILNGKLADGKFTPETVDGIVNQNNNSQYYCTDDYGCYYNWYTSTAGSGTTSTIGNATNDICPSNWALPTGGNNGEFKTLYSQYNSYDLMLVNNPDTTTDNTTGKIPGFLLSGACLTAGTSNAGIYGDYWSRTASNNQSTYGFYFRNANVSFNVSSKFAGLSVRCLAK